jgi:predicted transposase/invertase (TIGR01784 family)
VIYPCRSVEQSKVHPYHSLLNSEQVHRIYLDELGDARLLPIPIAATVLTILDETEAPEVAQNLLDRAEQADLTADERANIIDIVTSSMVYKFANLSRLEIRAMLGLDLAQEPRAIREAKEEGREEGREEGLEQGQEQGRMAEALALVTRLLTRRLGHDLPNALKLRLSALPLPMVEDLSEALLGFGSLADLEQWLISHELEL